MDNLRHRDDEPNPLIMFTAIAIAATGLSVATHFFGDIESKYSPYYGPYTAQEGPTTVPTESTPQSNK